jgi:hypothetical protein
LSTDSNLQRFYEMNCSGAWIPDVATGLKVMVNGAADDFWYSSMRKMPH